MAYNDPFIYFLTIKILTSMQYNIPVFTVIVGFTLWLTNCQMQSPGMPNTAQAAPATSLTPELRGAYLVSILGCDDCHTPKNMTSGGPRPDISRRLMGHPAGESFIAGAEIQKLIAEQHVGVVNAGMTAAAGPWGVSYAANLTPDDTGIGAWTETQFVKAMREGKSKGLDGARPILPPMPVAAFGQMTDDDLKAIFAFLKTMKPIQNVVPQPTGL